MADESLNCSRCASGNGKSNRKVKLTRATSMLAQAQLSSDPHQLYLQLRMLRDQARRNLEEIEQAIKRHIGAVSGG